MSGDLYAPVLSVSNVPLSKRVLLLVTVLSGEMRPHDEVELVHGDGTSLRTTVRTTPVKVVSPFEDDQQVTLEGVMRGDAAKGDLVRTPGYTLPQGAGESDLSTLAGRSLVAVRKHRLSGFEGRLAETIASLSDEAVVLLGEKRVRDALKKCTSPYALKDRFADAAEVYDAIGLQEDGDRLRLACTAALEGHEVGPGTRALASAAAIGALTIERASKTAQQGASLLGGALGLEIGDGFGVGFASSAVAVGEQIRLDLQREGRAVALGWCKKCRDAADLDERLRCSIHGKKCVDPVAVVPADAELARAAIRDKHA